MSATEVWLVVAAVVAGVAVLLRLVPPLVTVRRLTSDQIAAAFAAAAVGLIAVALILAFP